MVLMEDLVHQSKNLVLPFVNQTQNRVWFCIIMVIRVISLLMDKTALRLKPIIKMLTFVVKFI